jgi:glucose/arabinose dehydrogenase
MRYFLIRILIFATILYPKRSIAEIDTRPLDVQVVPAFPKLEWPDWLTKADQGLRRNLLPVVLTGDGSHNNRLFIATQYGSIHLLENNPETSQLSTFLDIRGRVHYDANENEEGLLGLAFHPQFSDNGQLFVYYTAKRDAQQLKRRSIVSRFRTQSGSPIRVDPDSEEVLIDLAQPYWNHNGGTLAFGPDGYLYIAVGDGGAGNDPHMNGQNLHTLLGSVLRIDVNRREKNLPYGIPPDNPFAGQSEFARGEIWAYGLRNVWRFSFDRLTGTCWGADVGQKTWEEINIIRRGGNYGWNLREGKHKFGPGGINPREDLIEPIWDYDRRYGQSITGGCVYRGASAKQLKGAYLYADYVSGRLWALWYDTLAGQVTANRPILEKGGPIITFGEDNAGEVYFTTFEGGIYKFAPSDQPPAAGSR